MKKTLSLTLSFAVAFLGAATAAAPSARGQEVASAGNSLSKIKEEYERLLAVERNPETTPEVREMNHKFLEERRAQLRDALQKRLRSLRAYQTSMAGTLSDSEGLVVANSIQALERDLSTLNGEQSPAQQKAAPSPALKPAPAAAPRARLIGARATRPAETAPAVETTKAADPAQPSPASAAAPARPLRQDAPKVAVAPPDDTSVDKPEMKVKVSFDDPQNKLGKKVEVKVVSGKNQQVFDAELPRVNEEGRTIAKPEGEVDIKLFEGKNTITASGTLGDDAKTAVASDPVDVTYEPKKEETAAAKPARPGAPTIDFVEAGARAVRVLADEAGADVKLFRNSAEIGTRKANSDKIAFFNLEDQAGIGNVFEAEQTVDDETSSRSRFVVTEGPFDDTRGGPVGIMLGGMVMSQQAGQFQQADPFLGFIAGYSSKLRNAFKMTSVRCGNQDRNLFYTDTDKWVDDRNNLVTCEGGVWQRGEKNREALVRGTGVNAWRWNLRFQGIFTAAPRAAETDDDETTTTGQNGGTTADDPFKFIASRKSFDADVHGWVDFWANNTFSFGPYGAFGASTVLDRNELRGEAVTKPKDKDDDDDDGDGEKVATSSKSDNDLKKYYEGGMLMSVVLPNRSLFIQSIMAYGHYEALRGLYNTKEGCRLCDSQHRFVGKLRIFPGGLIKGFGRQRIPAPIFGVDLNAGRGDDHVRFFTGLAINLKGFGFN